MPTVLIGGGSGMIGARLSQLLTDRGYTVWHLSRTPGSDDPYPAYYWDAEKGEIDQKAVDGADYIINLAGAGIADQPWTDKRKKIIIDSRVNTTDLLNDAIRRRAQLPKAFLSSAGISYYGDQNEKLLDEKDDPGAGFLPEVCIAWEAAVSVVAASGVRTGIIRTGVVLSTQGGALPRMTLPLHFFAGIYFGDGRQWMSWIHIDDLCRIFIHLMENEALSGVFNAVTPQPVRNREFINTVAKVRKKPAVMLPAPEFALKLVLGELSHTVLDSIKASAGKIEQSGFVFEFPDLNAALADVYRRKV